MKKFLLVALALVALNPRPLSYELCAGGLPQAAVSCSTGLQVHWGWLLTGGHAGLIGIYTKESAADAIVSSAVKENSPSSAGAALGAAMGRQVALTMLSAPCC